MAVQLIVMGVCGSGKTVVGKTLAEELGFEFFDADQFHSAENVKKMNSGTPLTDQDRLPWLNNMAEFLLERSKSNQSTVLACSALKKSYRDTLRTGTNVQFIFLKGDRETILPRLESRSDHFMPASLLDSQFDTLEEPNNAIAVSVSGSIQEIVRNIIENKDFPLKN